MIGTGIEGGLVLRCCLDADVHIACPACCQSEEADKRFGQGRSILLSFQWRFLWCGGTCCSKDSVPTAGALSCHHWPWAVGLDRQLVACGVSAPSSWWSPWSAPAQALGPAAAGPGDEHVFAVDSGVHKWYKCQKILSIYGLRWILMQSSIYSTQKIWQWPHQQTNWVAAFPWH